MDSSKFSEQFRRNEQEIYDWNEFAKKQKNPNLRDNPLTPEQRALRNQPLGNFVGSGRNTGTIYNVGATSREHAEELLSQVDVGEPVDIHDLYTAEEIRSNRPPLDR